MLFLLLWILSYMLFTVTLAQIKIGRPNGGAGGVPTNVAMNPLIAPLQHVQLPTSSQVLVKIFCASVHIANICKPTAACQLVALLHRGHRQRQTTGCSTHHCNHRYNRVHGPEGIVSAVN
jgi:hypothetical protein